MLQTSELDEIGVSDICKLAGLDRTTFYANYTDIYGLADSIRDKLEHNLSDLYQNEITRGFNSNDYLKLSRHIKDNQIFYKTYFKLGYDGSYRIITYDTNLARQHFENHFIEYHMRFLKSGITKIIKLWLQSGCKESPEDMYEIVKSEYQGCTDSGKGCSDTLRHRPPALLDMHKISAGRLAALDIDFLLSDCYIVRVPIVL